jgi:hypothetical protein
MGRKQLLEAVEHNAQVAREVGQEALSEVVERLAPYVEQAHERLTPLAEEAGIKVRPVLQQGARVASEAIERAQPALDDVLDRVGPAIDHAREAVQHEILPRLTTALEQLSQAQAEPEPLAELPAKKKSWKKRLGVLALVAAIVGALAYAVKKALQPPSEADWVTYTPSDSFIAHPDAEVTSDFVPSAETLTDPEDEGVVAGEEEPPATGDLEAAAEAEAAASAAAEQPEAPDYGEGSYVGDEPPEGYDIKGNAQSMKYHRPGQANYENTIPEVWFNSPEAAEAAGFVAAKR